MQNSPIVSVGMCAFNAQDYLAESIESILQQTYGQFELIIVDDGSTDDTCSVALSLAAIDSRIRVVRHETNSGLAAARNRTLSECKGQYFAIADADDIHLPERLAEQIRVLESEPEVGVVGSAVSFFGHPTGQPPRQTLHEKDDRIRFAMLFQPALWNTTTVYRVGLVRGAGGYRSCFDRGAEDYDLWCRLRSRTKFANVSRSLVKVRLHERSITAGNDDCLNNILEISRNVLSEFLGISVAFSQRKALHEVLNHQSLTAESHQISLPFLQQLVSVLQQREQFPEVSQFLFSLGQAVWIQAQYEVYRDSAVSDRYYDLAKELSFVPRVSQRGLFEIRRVYRHFRRRR